MLYSDSVTPVAGASVNYTCNCDWSIVGSIILLKTMKTNATEKTQKIGVSLLI